MDKLLDEAKNELAKLKSVQKGLLISYLMGECQAIVEYGIHNRRSKVICKKAFRKNYIRV